MNTGTIINLSHILLILPFLLWVGIARGNIPNEVFQSLIYIGAFVIIYQAYKSYSRWIQNSEYLWVNLFHVFFVGPLLLYIGIYKKETPKNIYDILLLVTFGGLGYHLYELASRLDFL